MFLPSMSAFIEDIHAVADLRWLGWSGAVADYWAAEGRRGGRGHYLSPDPRIVVFMDSASFIGMSTSPERSGMARIAFVPAGVPLWSHVHADGSFSHLDLHFSTELMAQSRKAGASLPSGPVLLDAHEGIEQLARLITCEVVAQRKDPVLLDSLLMAMLAYFHQTGQQGVTPETSSGGLTPAQHRRVMQAMQHGLHRRISVAELADLTGLSESWFSRAFRSATGETPARALVRLRVERAKSLLVDGQASLADVAAATGFSDQAHFTRVFRCQTGTTPATWRLAARA